MIKKNIKLITIIISIILLIGICLLTYFINNKDQNQFKIEYESLNNKIDSNGNKYMKLNLPNTNIVKYINSDEAIDILKNKTGVIYFGFPECPWCRNIVEPLLEVINENEIDTLYYLNNKEDRDIKKLDDNEFIITEKEGHQSYYQIVDILKDYLGEYTGLNDSNIKRLYYPTVVFVYEGQIMGVHIGTVESHTIGRDILTDNQKQKLKNIYQTYIDKTFEGLCDITC